MRILAAILVVLAVFQPAASFGFDTAGVMLAAEGFYHTNLVSAEWRAIAARGWLSPAQLRDAGVPAPRTRAKRGGKTT